MVHTHSLRSPINIQNCARISQIGDIAHLPHPFLPYIGEATSTSRIAGPNKFQLIISFGQYSGDDSLYIVFVLVKLLLEDLLRQYGTLGMVSEENSET